MSLLLETLTDCWFMRASSVQHNCNAHSE